MRVLAIDDDESYRLLVAEMMRLAVPDAEVEAYDPARGFPGKDLDLGAFDLVLLDYRLGAENGLEWLRRFKQHEHCPAVVMLTGEGSESVVVQAIKAGADDYLPKEQLDRDQLKRIVADAMTAKGLQSKDETVQLDSQAIASGNPQTGVRIEGYRLVRDLGEGAVSRVYLVAPEAGGAPIAAKVLREELIHDSDFLTRFLREYEIFGRIRSRHVGRIFSYGFSDNSAYILMEYIGGGDVRTYFAENYVNQGKTLSIFRQLLAALSDVHAAGVVHRDLKPHNVMFRDDGSLAMVDFGIARIVGEPSITQQGTLLGTPNYMSPEMVAGKPVDARSDLYSAGVLLYQILAKKPPFEADTPGELMQRHLHDAPPPLPRAQDEFQPLIDALLAKDPERRPASAGAALALIEELYFRRA
jgi:CheY-like chemotaxis protein